MTNPVDPREDRSFGTVGWCGALLRTVAANSVDVRLTALEFIMLTVDGSGDTGARLARVINICEAAKIVIAEVTPADPAPGMCTCGHTRAAHGGPYGCHATLGEVRACACTARAEDIA